MCNSLESSDTHQTGDLADGDCDGGTGHETTYGGGGNEFDNPTNPQKAYAKDDEPLEKNYERFDFFWKGGTRIYTDESDCCSDLGASPLVGMRFLYMFDDLRYGQGHDRHGTDGHVLGGGKELETRD